MTRALFSGGVLLATLLRLIPSAHAQDAARWDALGRTLSSAREAGIQVTRVNARDQEALDGESALWIHDADTAPPPDALLEHVRAGGRLLVADERPAAASLLNALGFRLGPPPDETLERVGGHPALFAANATKALAYPGVERVVTNLPARLEPTVGTETLLQFADGAALMQRSTVGRGVVMALADGSVCIDLMLESDENARFCAALIGALTQQGQRGLRVFGATSADAPDAPTEGTHGEALLERATLARETLNEAISDLSRPAPPEALVRAVVALCVAVAIVLAAARFPGLRWGRRAHGPRRRARQDLGSPSTTPSSSQPE
jgi:hypothetical protein